MKPWTWDRVPVSQKRKLRLRDSVMSSRVTSQNVLTPEKYHNTYYMQIIIDHLAGRKHYVHFMEGATEVHSDDTSPKSQREQMAELGYNSDLYHQGPCSALHRPAQRRGFQTPLLMCPECGQCPQLVFSTSPLLHVEADRSLSPTWQGGRGISVSHQE